MVVETFESGINWLEPRDISIHQALCGIQSENRPGISSTHRNGLVILGVGGVPGANVLMANGVVRFLPDDTPPEILGALLTANGGEDFIQKDDGAIELAPRANRQ